MLDTLIHSGTIVDGTGAPRFRGDIGITDGRIVFVRPTPEAPRTPGTDADSGTTPAARTVLDASGKVVCPGFIDLHSHGDFTVHGSPTGETQLLQGVTTAVLGNCGSSPFPTHSVADTAAHKGHLNAVLHGEWSDATGYIEATRAVRPGLNLVLQLGLSNLRTFVMGPAERAPSAAELAAMQDEIRKAAAVGVRGFSTGLIYAPASYAQEDEITALVATAAECDMLYSTHMRNESGGLLDAVDEAIRTAENAGARLEISHLKAMGPAHHGLTAQAFARIEAARTRGVDVMADVYPYTASSTTLTSRMPGWALDGGFPALLARLSDPEARDAITAEVAAGFARGIGPESVVIASVGARTTGPSAPGPNGSGGTGTPDHTWAVGRSIAEIAEAEECSPAEAAARLLHAHSASVAIINHGMDEEEVASVLRHPLVSVASDGAVLSMTRKGTPHPRAFGTFVRVLDTYVRERGVLSLEEAIRKMTSLPAGRLGTGERGTLRDGAVADVVVFDPATVKENATFLDPWQLASGVSEVLVNGVFAVAGGALTENRAGEVLTEW